MNSDTLTDAGTRDSYRFSTNFLLTLITSSIFLGAAVIFFLRAWPQYTSEQYIDFKLRLLKPEEVKWLLLIFLIPLVVQLGCFCIFFFFGARKKQSLLLFYGVCLTVMFFSSAGYCYLFDVYTDARNYERGLNYSEGYSYVALSLVCVLLLAVGLITYAIIWNPPAESPREDWRLVERDIDWREFIKRLTDGSTSYHLNGRPVNGFLRKVYEAMGTASRRSITAAHNNGGEVNDETQAALCRELNTILKRRDLYLAVEVGDIDPNVKEGREAVALLRRAQATLSGVETRRLNRLLLKAFCGPAIRKEVPPPGWLSRCLTWVRRKWQSLLSRLKEGIVELHFWVLVFFFTVFLSINYLLGFAFAFHDKAVERRDGYPAMVLAKARPSSAGAPSLLGDGAAGRGGGPLEAGETNAATKVNYAFYFDSKSAVPQFEDDTFDERGYPAATKAGLELRSERWRKIKNYKHLGEAATAIDALTRNGEWLRVELIGSADGDQLNDDTTYTSNYALSEARAQQVKYRLMKKLAERGDQQRNIEWVSLPLSNETLQPPLSRQERDRLERENKADEASIGRGGRAARRGLSDAERELLSGEYNRWKYQVWPGIVPRESGDYVESKVDQGQQQYLEDKVRKVFDAIIYNAEQGQKLTAAHRRELYEKVQDLANILQNINRNRGKGGERVERLTEMRKVKEDELDSSLEALTYLDEDDAKRVVVVSLAPMHSNHQYLPLSLMDYMYFTTYTITTTGYGDITPTTTYTKFLCSVANIIEVFFLVVFFNALLSVKDDGKSSRLSSVT